MVVILLRQSEKFIKEVLNFPVETGLFIFDLPFTDKLHEGLVRCRLPLAGMRVGAATEQEQSGQTSI
jgi:hypothetical protein